MGIEKERKYIGIYNRIPKDWSEEFFDIKQGYLMINEDSYLRIRIEREFYQICYKKIINKDEKYEFEYDVPKEDAEKLMELSELVLDKKRLDYFLDGAVMSIDIYPEKNEKEPLTVIEIELINSKMSFPNIELLREKFPFIGREITGLREYSNIEIAKRWCV